MYVGSQLSSIQSTVTWPASVGLGETEHHVREHVAHKKKPAHLMSERMYQEREKRESGRTGGREGEKER